MRPTLADYMRNNALKMESAELAPVTEIVAPVSIPDGVEERSRDHLILLPSPGVASTVQVGVGEGDAFEPLTEEQVGVSTVSGNDGIASAINVRDRKLAGELRIRYVPVDVAMESDDKPFVQLGTVVEPGSENKNPFPANAPTEEAAAQVTNQPTIERDRGEQEDKAKIAENAVDQSVAPKVNVTVVEKGAETTQQDNDKVVDANDGNTGERKAEEAAKETELKGPKEDETSEDNSEVNTGGEDPTAAAASEDEAATEGDAASEETSEEGDVDGEEETEEGDEEETDEEDEDEEEEELKQEGFNLTVLIDQSVALTMESGDEDKKSGMLARAWKALMALVARVRKWLDEKIFSKVRKARREKGVEQAKEAADAVDKIDTSKWSDEARERVQRHYTYGVREIKKYEGMMSDLADLAVDGRPEFNTLRNKVMTAVRNQDEKSYGPLTTECEKLFTKYKVGELFGVAFGDSGANIGADLRDQLERVFKKEHRAPSTELTSVMRTIYQMQFDYTRKLNGGVSTESRDAAAASGEIKYAEPEGGAAARETNAEFVKLLRNMSLFENAAMAAVTCSSIIEASMMRFVEDVLAVVDQSDLVTESYKPTARDFKYESIEIISDLDALATPLAMEADAKESMADRAFNAVKKLINRVILWFKNTVLGGARKKQRRSAAEAAERLVQSLDRAKELRKEAIEEVERTYTVGIAKLHDYSQVMTMLAVLATDGQKELTRISLDAFMVINKDNMDKYVKDLEAWGKKYHTKELFGVAFENGSATDSEKLEAEIRQTFKGDKATGLDRSKLDKAAKEIRDVLKPYTTKLNEFSDVANFTEKTRSQVLGEQAKNPDTQKVARYLTLGFNYVTAGIKISQIMEGAMKDFIMAAKNTLARELSQDGVLKQEHFEIITDLNALATPLVMEDADKSGNILSRLWEKLLAHLAKVRAYIAEKIFGKVSTKTRDERIEEAEVLVQAWPEMPEEVKEKLTTASFKYTVGVRDMKKQQATSDKYMNILVQLRTDAGKVAKDAIQVMMSESAGEGEIRKQIDACAALLKKYNIDTLFPSTGKSGDQDDAFSRTLEASSAHMDPFHEEITDFTEQDVRNGVLGCKDFLKHVRTKLGHDYQGAGSELLDAKTAGKRFNQSNNAEVRELIGAINELWAYVLGASKMVTHTEVAAKRFIRDVSAVLRAEGKPPILNENKEKEEELTQLSADLHSELAAINLLALEDGETKKGIIGRALESLGKFIAKIKAWLMDNVFARGRKKKREAAAREIAALAKKLQEDKDKIEPHQVSNLNNRYTVGIRDLAKYKVVMDQLAALGTAGIKDLEVISAELYSLLNKPEKIAAVVAKLEGFFKTYHIATLFNVELDAASGEPINNLHNEISKAFNQDKATGLDLTKLAKSCDDMRAAYTAYNKQLDAYDRFSERTGKSNLDLSKALAQNTDNAELLKAIRLLNSGYAYAGGAMRVASVIERSMNEFAHAAYSMILHLERQAEGKEELKTEGFSQPVELLTAPSDMSPVVIPADKPFLPESLVVTRINENNQLVILRDDKVSVRTNDAGLGEAIVVVDPALQGQIQANYEAVVSGELPVMEGDEDPVVTLDVVTDDRDGVEIRVAQMVDGDSEEAIPEELVELRAEGAIALEAHQNCIKGLSSIAYMVDMANSIQFEGDEQAAELVMEGMLDSIKGAMTRLGNWLDKSLKYQKVWDINWNQSLAAVQKEIRKAKSGTAKADIVKLNRVVRNLTINGAPVTDLRELQRQLAEIAKVGNDAKAHMVAVGNLYEDVRRLIAKHDNVNPDGAAILKEIPALVKKVNLRPWAAMVKGERQVSEKSAERVPTSAPFLGDVVVAERQSLNDLTYANPDKALRAMLEKTYVGYRVDWELDRDLTSAEMKVLTPQEMDALITSLRKASEAWDLLATVIDTGKKMDAFYRSLWSLKQYDRDFLSAYGVIIAADQWAYHPVLDMRFDFAYPMQAVLRLVSINCAAYK